MEKLKTANLYRSELIPVSGKLVERYNKCLKKLGFSETKLTSFSIDGVGWSPEIAEEKKDKRYLNNGEANLHAIIITPLQQNKPVYMPFHSFDRDMMKAIFRRYKNKITDITKDSAICVDFDQNIDAFYEPLDVLKYDEVTIKLHLINDLDQAQKEQQELIRKFKTGTNFIDETIHQELLASAKKYGDLRNRDIELINVTYKTGSFFTEAFGGVYLLRDFISPIIIFENEKYYKEAIKDTFHDVIIFHIKQPELMKQLRDHVIIEYDLAEEITTKRYERVKKYVFFEKLKDTQHPIQKILDDEMLFKSYLNKMDLEDRKEVMGVERYVEKIQTSNQYKINDLIQQDLFNALHSPHSSLKPEHQDLIWKLLVTLSDKDVLFLYWYDKEAFYTKFKSWDASMQDWVIATICNNI